MPENRDSAHFTAESVTPSQARYSKNKKDRPKAVSSLALIGGLRWGLRRRKNGCGVVETKGPGRQEPLPRRGVQRLQRGQAQVPPG